MAKGDLDFLKERNICSACCLCSVLTIDGGACSYKRFKKKNWLKKGKFENVQNYLAAVEPVQQITNATKTLKGLKSIL